MTMQRSLINRSLQMLHIGENEIAQKILLSLLEKDPYSGTILLMYINTFETRHERSQVVSQIIQKRNISI